MLHSHGTISNSRLGDDDALQFVDYLSMNDNMSSAFNPGVYFESAVTMGDSWHYQANEELKSPQALMERLINAAGNGGNLSVECGAGSGRCPLHRRPWRRGSRRWEEWLQRNGEAIYGTRGWALLLMRSAGER